jgi:hypothetical protein
LFQDVQVVIDSFVIDLDASPNLGEVGQLTGEAGCNFKHAWDLDPAWPGPRFREGRVPLSTECRRDAIPGAAARCDA